MYELIRCINNHDFESIKNILLTNIYLPSNIQKCLFLLAIKKDNIELLNILLPIICLTEEEIKLGMYLLLRENYKKCFPIIQNYYNILIDDFMIIIMLEHLNFEFLEMYLTKELIITDNYNALYIIFKSGNINLFEKLLKILNYIEIDIFLEEENLIKIILFCNLNNIKIISFNNEIINSKNIINFLKLNIDNNLLKYNIYSFI